ncbi:MAG: aspartyl-phosphate phosphatase Spo0E family protein [Christensenellales bacterium]|jgi:hypothetical protein
MKSDIETKLKIEKARLNALVEEAMKKGQPTSDNQEILEQSRKVDILIAKKQKQMADRDRHEPSR